MTTDQVVPEPTQQTVHDPVCHMDIVGADAAGSSEHDGKTYYFCSKGCQNTFEADPAGVMEKEENYTHS